MEVATLDGLEGVPGAKKRQSSRRTHEVVSVRENEAGHCVPAGYGPPGSAQGQRLVDLCRNAGIRFMNVAGRIYNTQTGKIVGQPADAAGLEGTMDNYEAMEFPAIEGLEMIDGLVDKEYVTSHLKVAGFQIGARVVVNGLKAAETKLPTFTGSRYIYPVLRALVGVAGGRALYPRAPQAAMILSSRVLEQAVVDDLIMPLLAQYAPSVYGFAKLGLGTVDIEPQRVLAGISPAEVRALANLDAVGIEPVGPERQLGTVDVERLADSGLRGTTELILSGGSFNPRYAASRKSLGASIGAM